jgi:uncharacterized repeat protein (TIGR02543 family)
LARVYVNPKVVTAKAPSVVILTVSVENVVDLFAYQIALRWNPKILQLTSVSDAGFLGKDVNFNHTYDNTKGTLLAEASKFKGAQGTTGSGNLLNLTFQKTAEEATTIHLQTEATKELPYTCLLLDTSFTTIPSSWEDGLVTEANHVAISKITVHDATYCVKYDCPPSYQPQEPNITPGSNQAHFPAGETEIVDIDLTDKVLWCRITFTSPLGSYTYYKEFIDANPMMSLTIPDDVNYYMNPSSEASVTVEAGYFKTPYEQIKTDTISFKVYPARTLTINVSPSEGGTTDPEPALYLARYNTSTTVKAIPAKGYIFSHWLLNGKFLSTENPVTTPPITANSTLTAVFTTAPTHQLTVQTLTDNQPLPSVPFTIDSKQVSTDQNGVWRDILPEETYTITMPTTVGDYTFSHWENGLTNPTRTIILTRDTTITAYYVKPPPTHTLTVNIEPANAGTVTLNPPGGVYPEGTNVTATAKPNLGYTFDHWLLDSETRAENPTTITMDKDYTLTAVFKETPTHTLTIAVNDPTMGTTNPPPGTYTHPEGSTVTVQALPNPNYKFVNWTLDSQTRTENPITITMDRDYTLTANFQPIPAGITITGTVKGIFGNPVSGATVTLNGQTTRTDPSGKYTFTNLTPAVYRITVQHWLYETQSKAIAATEAKTYTVDFQLSIKTPILMSGLSAAAMILGLTTYKILFPPSAPKEKGGS